MSTLYVAATPIGNLEDLTDRVKRIFSESDLICAEDTRVTQKLLNHLGLHKNVISCHRHNEALKCDSIIEQMTENDMNVMLVCDAGTPGISDPGYILVDAAWKAGFRVIPVSGPNAAATAVSCSGFDAREFAFYGFLPREKKALREKLAAILDTGIQCAVIYESPHRVLELAETMGEIWPGSRVCVDCDLTKYYEKIYRGDIDAVITEMRANDKLEKGEYCIVADLSGVKRSEKKTNDVSAAAFMLEQLLNGSDIAGAARSASEAGYPRNTVYRDRLRIEEMFEDDCL